MDFSVDINDNTNVKFIINIEPVESSYFNYKNIGIGAGIAGLSGIGIAGMANEDRYYAVGHTQLGDFEEDDIEAMFP